MTELEPPWVKGIHESVEEAEKIMTEQKWTDEVELCHCSRPTVKEFHESDGHGNLRDYCSLAECDEEHVSRGMCKECDMVRCDVFPGACKTILGDLTETAAFEGRDEMGEL